MIKNLNPNLRLIDCHEATHAKAILDILNEAIINLPLCMTICRALKTQ